MKKITTKGVSIYIFKQNETDYISLTDIARFKDKERTEYVVQNWMRNRDTIEFLGIWEHLNNPNFKHIEFDVFKNQAGSNSFSLTPKRWIGSVNAIGLINKAGRYGGGTFAHKDIAFEFASWISAEFKLYLIKEFQRLKEDSELEVDFIKYLENSKSVEWWFKNGKSDATYFAVPHVEYGIEKPFYVDFIVVLKDGKVGLFDTKGGFTAELARTRAEGLSTYISEENKKGKELFGGIILKEKNSWRYNDGKDYSYNPNDLKDWDFLNLD